MSANPNLTLTSLEAIPASRHTEGDGYAEYCARLDAMNSTEAALFLHEERMKLDRQAREFARLDAEEDEEGYGYGDEE